MRAFLLQLLLSLAWVIDAQAQTSYWAQSISGTPSAAHLVDGPVVGLDGRVTTVHSAVDTVRVGTTLLIPNPALRANNPTGYLPRNQDSWLVMQSAAGRVLHVVRATQHLGALQSVVHTDSVGNVYWAGTFFNQVQLGTTLLQAAGSGFTRWDSFLCKLDSAGNVLWARTLGNTPQPGGENSAGRYLRFIRVDGAGNVYVAGSFIGPTTVAGVAMTTSPVYFGEDLFVASFSPGGQTRWARQYGSAIYKDAMQGFGVTPRGDIYLAYTYRVVTDLGPLQLRFSGGGGDAMAVAKLDASGTPLWLRGMDSPREDRAVRLTVLPEGGCAVYLSTGQANAHLGLSLASGSYVVRFAPTGDAQWAARFMPPYIGGLAADAAGSIYVGACVSTAAVDAGNGVTLTPTGSGNMVPAIVAFNTQGQAQWAVQGQSAASSAPLTAFPVNGVAVTPTGDLYGLAIGQEAIILGTDTIRSAYNAAYYALWQLRPPVVLGAAGAPVVQACPGAQFALPFAVGAGLTAGNVFTAQLSDSLGRFSQPLAVGTLAGTASGSIAVTVPTNLPPASGYRLRVVASAPRTIYSAGAGVSVRVHSGTYVVLTTTAPVSLCQGASPVSLRGEAGVGAGLQWLRNGQPISGATTAAYTPTQSGSYALQATSNCGTSVSAAVAYTIYPLPTVALLPFAPVALGQPAFALTGGSPAGGTYSGPGVSGNVFDPQAAGTGIHTITYTYVDANGCQASATNSLEVRVTLATRDQEAAQQLTAFPNPVTDMVQVQWRGHTTHARISLVNALGQVVRTQQVILAGTAQRVSCHGLPAGVYQLVVRLPDAVFTRPLLLQP